MAVGKGLGRGLDVLLKGLAVDNEAMEVTMVKVSDVRPNPRQPRVDFSQESLVELAASVKEQGVLQPIIVRPANNGPEHGYELVAGERRLRACKMAGLDAVPAIVREIDDQQSLALALIENLQRENLNALEEAKGFDQLQHTFGLSQEMLAQKMGRSRSAIANSLRLLQLNEQMQESLRDNLISAGHARALLAVSDDAIRVELWQRMLDTGLSVREAEALVNTWREIGSLPADDLSDKAKKIKTPPQKRPDPDVKALEALLKKHFGLKVKLGGDRSQGKITIAYHSEDQLQALLNRFGVESGF